MTMSTERIFHPDAPQGIQPPAVHTHLPRFGLIVVGDEILSGRRQDGHVPKMIELLGERGLALSYVHMLGDNRTQLTQLLRQVLASGDVVMCCGGIGATPDDHTRQAAAAAAGVTLALHLGNHVGNGKSLARAGYAQQGLVNLAVFNAFDQLRNGAGLVARRWVRLKKLKG